MESNYDEKPTLLHCKMRASSPSGNNTAECLHLNLARHTMQVTLFCGYPITPQETRSYGT
ncbi:hypothetical protein AMTR_s00011p00107440 [Amborella trichopoda]|uniref:Uncharacterized protein n=1 Tax=Amborella trichopoda TaxID=13333 RepID=W1NGK4_AMBTC|nr:hypothetical protein AMTR_s00011p00107440 [Amborella trichopoda]